MMILNTTQAPLETCIVCGSTKYKSAKCLITKMVTLVVDKWRQSHHTVW